MKSNLFLVGAAKSGTTSLYDYLAFHDEIYAPDNKEPHFFLDHDVVSKYSGPDDANVVSRMFISEIDEYERLYFGGEGFKYRIDASASYLYRPECASKIFEYNPDAKIIIMLRNPIDRAFSAYSHMRRDFREPQSSFFEAVLSEPDRIKSCWMPIWHYLGMGYYSAQVERYISCYGRDKVFVCFFEEFVVDKRRVLSDICKFLCLDSISGDLRLEKISNDSRIPKNKGVHLFVRNPNIFKSIVKPLIPRKIRKSLIDKVKSMNSGGKLSMELEMRDYLRDLYSDDVEKLKSLLGQDLEVWNDFRIK